MGICHRYHTVQFFQDVCREERIVLAGLKMAELGNQRIRENVLGVEVSAKRVFEFLGVRHVSFDLNGSDGALSYDLRERLPEEFLECFDMVTNFGTIEHVETHQYEAWRNVWKLCRPRGLILHHLPMQGSWRSHCRYHFSEDQVAQLAEAAGYQMRAFRIVEGPVRGTDSRKVIMFYHRKPWKEFIDRETFQRIMGFD